EEDSSKEQALTRDDADERRVFALEKRRITQLCQQPTFAEELETLEKQIDAKCLAFLERISNEGEQGFDDLLAAAADLATREIARLETFVEDTAYCYRPCMRHGVYCTFLSISDSLVCIETTTALCMPQR
ncbi:MAG: hypothetical protein AAFS10_07015, partial [Myxococcota bacterium]